MTNNNSNIAIVGSGITGLTTAFLLKKRGKKVTVFEKNSQPGGSIRTVRNGDWLTEYGPNTILLKDRIVDEFFTELGLNDHLIEANPSASKRYIVKNGQIVPLPSTLLDAVKTPLFSLGGKLRVLKEPFITRSNQPDQTVAEFVSRRLGQEVLDYAINPFVAGIFANNPESLSLRHAFPLMHNLESEYGSLIVGSFAGARKRKESGRIKRKLVSFKGGLQELPIKLAEKLNILYSMRIDTVEKRVGGWFLKSNDAEYGPFDQVILNIPLYQMKDLNSPFQNELEEIGKKVYYPPLSVVHLSYNKEDVGHELDGFGFLVPEVEQRNILGALFSSSLFQGRAPIGKHLLTIFIGGGRQPELASMETEKLMRIVESELSDLIGLNGKTVYQDHVYWPKSIPAYHIGYDEILEKMKQIEEIGDGLSIAGNFRNGISVPDCIKNGIKLAEKI